MILVLAALAGGLGAASRFLVDSAVAKRHRGSTPIGTIVVNVTSCLLLGILTGLALHEWATDEFVAVVGVGFLGGYSTFSTASVEAARLLLAGRTGTALGHAAAMLLLSLVAALAGVALGSL